ncbi:Hsp20/alpha crystallin family protein [Halovivax sp.]|uniref:Hsp20/alpha crystallin family protein n=1 Tax=Halovivax sp. TaxID=1935978 RepID=UPI0025C0DF02|nr:Hsp20/alpha crystallin family protein [Halovivax sp.]
MSFRGVRDAVGRRLFRGLGRTNGHIQKTKPVPADVLENGSAYLVIFDTPGTEPDDLEIRYLNGRVKIRIDRFRAYYDGFEMRFPGRSTELDGAVELPADAIVDPEAATARLSEVGTVKIEIPKESSAPIDESNGDEPESEAEEIPIDD